VGLFDYFTREGKLKRHARRMADRDANPEDREASMFWLLDDGSPDALRGLLSRFDLQLSQQLKDKKEKDALYEHLVGVGADVVPPLREHLRYCKVHAYPLRLLAALEGEAAAVEAAVELLAKERGASFQPERKVALLLWLAERRHAGAIEAAAPFLSDFDENVRCAAVEVLVYQEDAAAAGPLREALQRDGEDSGRLRHRIAEVFKQRSWPVDDAVSDHLPAGFAVAQGRVVAR
jgi:hypothetical protein